MTIKEMNRYMCLVNRMMWIIDHSGISWQPEYAEEAEQIRKELKELQPIIEEARSKQRRNRTNKKRNLFRFRGKNEFIKIHYKKDLTKVIVENNK